MISSGWRKARIGEIAEVKGGKRLPAGYYLQATPTHRPYIRVADMRVGGVDQSDIKYVPESAVPRIQNYRIYTDDIFISVAGTLGIVGRVPISLDGANLTENADRLTNIKCDVAYLMYALQSNPIQDEIDSIRTVGAQPKLALSRIRSFEILMPSDQAEQSRVSRALSDTDDLIESLERLISKKQAIKQGMMQELLTGKTRSPGFTSPWQNYTLGDHVSFLSTVGLSRAQLDLSSPLKYLHYGDIHTRSSTSLNATSEEMPRARAALANRASLLRKGDLVFADASEDIAGVGKSVEIVDTPDSGVVAGLHTIAARFDKLVLADGFKSFLQFIPSFRGHLLRLAAGTKVLATSKSGIASAVVSLPVVSEQQAIAQVLHDADDEIAALERRLESASNIKQGMMQELLSGRTRLPIEEVSS